MQPGCIPSPVASAEPFCEVAGLFSSVAQVCFQWMPLVLKRIVF